MEKVPDRTNDLALGVDPPFDEASIALILDALQAQPSREARTLADRLRSFDPSAAERDFEALAARWEKETRSISSLTEMILNENYQRVIGLGKAAIPLILLRLQRRPNHWFWALTAISGENPVAAEDAGSLPRMTEKWLHWGKVQATSPRSVPLDLFDRFIASREPGGTRVSESLCGKPPTDIAGRPAVQLRRLGSRYLFTGHLTAVEDGSLAASGFVVGGACGLC